MDPYNELDHQRPSFMSETEYVSQMLTKIKRFAQHHDVHVWFVAHPRQMRDWKGQPPTMYDISGSAHFINKADNGLVIHRNRDPEAGPMNEVRDCRLPDHSACTILAQLPDRTPLGGNLASSVSACWLTKARLRHA